MAYPQTANLETVQIPISGMSYRHPLSAMPPQYSPYMLNIEPEPQYLRVRNAWRRHCVVDAVDYILGLGSFGGNLYAYCQGTGVVNNRIYDVTTATESLAATSSGATADQAWMVKFGQRAAFTTETGFATCPMVATYGTPITWAAWGFTHDPGTGAVAIGGPVVTSYKGRVYIFNNTSMYYSTLAAVTGATTLVDLSTLFDDYGVIVWAGQLASPTLKNEELLLAFGTDKGEVLVYAGDYPGATNWQQAAKFQIPKPIYYNAALSFRNDIWIVTETSIVSLRKLFVEGSDSTENVSVSAEIDPYWTALVNGKKANAVGLYYNSNVSIAYWPEQNKVFVLTGGQIDRDGTYAPGSGTMLVHNLISKAWCPLSAPGVGQSTSQSSLTYHDNGLYFTIDNVVMKYDPTSWYDQQWNDGSESLFSWELDCAYSDFSGGQIGKQRQVAGIAPILKTDFNGSYVGAKVASDFGRKISAASYAPLGSGYQTPYYAVGNAGQYIQPRMLGQSDNTSTIGCEFYALGVAVK